MPREVDPGLGVDEFQISAALCSGKDRAHAVHPLPAALRGGARPDGTQEPWGSDGLVPLAVPPQGQDGPQEGSLPRGAAAALGVSVPTDGPCASGVGISSRGLACWPLAASELHLPGAFGCGS